MTSVCKVTDRRAGMTPDAMPSFSASSVARNVGNESGLATSPSSAGAVTSNSISGRTGGWSRVVAFISDPSMRYGLAVEEHVRDAARETAELDAVALLEIEVMTIELG